MCSIYCHVLVPSVYFGVCHRFRSRARACTGAWTSSLMSSGDDLESNYKKDDGDFAKALPDDK